VKKGNKLLADLFFCLLVRMEEPRKFIQVLAGPRQVGKTTSFLKNFPKANLILVGRHGIPYDLFMKTELSELFAGI
jgi:hypothetical protein